MTIRWGPPCGPHHGPVEVRAADPTRPDQAPGADEMKLNHRVHGLLASPAVLFALALIPAAASADPIEEQRAELAQKGYGFLKNHCQKCHGLQFKVEGFD